jgi:translation initiation factor 3 subunit E
MAMGELEKLKTAIDARKDSDKQQLQQRTWFLHWSLFVFWNHPKGCDSLIDTFLSEKYLQAIQINAPWLLRYLTTAVIINKRRREQLPGLVTVIQQEHYTYSDPITKFLECLRVDFDFDGAQERLGECTEVLKSDYFLCNCTDEFVKAARFFIFET